jgi:hypothetical protein
MKFSAKNVIAVAIISILALYLLNCGLIAKKAGPGAGGKSWTVYGSNGCGWTRKQLKSMEDKNSNHKFIDCDKEDCGDVSAFPTTKDSDGKTTVGFDANLG